MDVLAPSQHRRLVEAVRDGIAMLDDYRASRGDERVIVALEELVARSEQPAATLEDQVAALAAGTILSLLGSGDLECGHLSGLLAGLEDEARASGRLTDRMRLRLRRARAGLDQAEESGRWRPALEALFCSQELDDELAASWLLFAAAADTAADLLASIEARPACGTRHRPRGGHSPPPGRITARPINCNAPPRAPRRGLSRSRAFGRRFRPSASA